MSCKIPRTATISSAKVTKKTSTSDAQKIRAQAIETARKSGRYTDTVNNLVLQSVSQIDNIDANSEISTSGFELSQDSIDAINNQISSIEGAGYSLSFVVTDISTGNTVAYKSRTARYTASSIKGSVVLADFAQGKINSAQTDATVANWIQQTITVSNNDTYASLVQQYGMTPLHDWVSGVNIDADIGITKYTWMSAADFAKMWVLGYDYLFGTQTMESSPNSNYDAFHNAALNDTNKQWFSQYFVDSENLFISQALDNTVYSKAGWINTDQYFLSQNDAGIVKSDTGDYVVSVMSTAYGEYDLLSSLVSQLASVHDSEMTAQ